MSALRFHLCNLSSIVRDYYQLFNYSDDIYQGQLYRAVSCRENGLSVLLLHSQAEECAAEAVQVGVKNLWLDLFLLRECPHSHKGCYKLPIMISAFLLTFQSCLFPSVAIVFLLNTSSTSLMSPQVSLITVIQTSERIGLQVSYFLLHKGEHW